MTGFGQDVQALVPAAANSAEVRTVFSNFPAAVGALCAEVDGELVGLVATSLAVGISYDPPMVLFSVRNASTTWPLLQRADRIGISVLAEGQSALCRQLAGKQDRFTGVDVTVSSDGAAFIGGAVTWMDCEVSGQLGVGDHTVVTFRIHAVSHSTQDHPLVFHSSRFPRLRHADSDVA